MSIYKALLQFDSTRQVLTALVCSYFVLFIVEFIVYIYLNLHDTITKSVQRRCVVALRLCNNSILTIAVAGLAWFFFAADAPSMAGVRVWM
jgi:hypothetical protein